VRVNSYDANAPVPKDGSRWVWEADTPHARALIEVVESVWNGEEWFVRTRTLLPRVTVFPGDEEKVYVNDLGRFWEACIPVLPKVTGRLDTFAERRASA
jgi:hypothetical protein